MKKVVAIISIIVFCFLTFSIFNISKAANIEEVTNTNTNGTTTGKLIELKDKELKTLDEYKEAYGSDSYGLTAFLLNKVRLYSIPCCFVAIVIAAIYKYIIGIRKMDVSDKGFGLMIASITILVICQILPLIFAIVVKGWRG